jgi:hypothetical protein
MTGGPPRGRVVTGRVTRIEACPCGGIVLSVGPISLRLDAEASRSSMVPCLSRCSPAGTTSTGSKGS